MKTQLPSLSIILPVYNEVKSLAYVIESWDTFLNSREIIHEFVVCEDGSTDGTKELIKDLQTRFPISNQSVQERRGYGGGVVAGIKASKMDYIMCIDSDGQCMPDSFDEFFSHRNDADIVIGCRSPRRDPLVRKVYSFLFHVLHAILFKSGVRDPSCPYILAKKNIYLRLLPSLSYMKEGFWWGFVGAAVISKMTFAQTDIIHYERYDGSTVVYKLGRMPSIILRNVIGLFKLRFSNPS